MRGRSVASMKKRLLLIVATLCLFVGCETTSRSNSTSYRNISQPQTSAEQENRSSRPSEATHKDQGGVVAYINGKPLYSSTIQTALYEAAGSEVLSEQILAMLLRERLRQRGIQISSSMLENERRIMLTALSPDPDEAARLWQEIRQRRGLGKRRIDEMLWRNAALRALVQPEIQVTPAAVEMAYQMQYGPKYIARMIVTPNSRDASRARQRVTQGETFSEVAATASIDSSGLAGGLLPPISPDDPQYPKVIRDQLASMRPGQISSVIALDDNFAILKLERIRPAENIALASVQSQLRDSVRRELERLRMQQLANGMLDGARVVVLQPALNESWHASRGQ